MGGGIPVFKIFGITIRLHYSWFIIFGILTWSLVSTPQLFTPQPLSLPARLIGGIVASLLLFASLVAHEVMHSVVAQSTGIPVKAITLFIFGGVSEITQEPKKPGEEFKIAIAGPATSLALSLVFVGISLFSPERSLIQGISLYLGNTNLILAIFNLIPGFPLDGGRVLRSILWKRNGDLRKATMIAANIGRGIGYLMIIGGLVFISLPIPYLGIALGAQGLWIALIGWFLETAAASSYRQVALNDILRGHTASEVLSKDCTSVSQDMTVKELVNEQILTGGRRCFPVVDGEKAVGLITLNDIRAVPRNQWESKKVSEAMIPAEKMVSVGPNEDLSRVFQILTEKDINQVPVIEDGKILGMIGRDTLLSFVRTRTYLGMNKN